MKVAFFILFPFFYFSQRQNYVSVNYGQGVVLPEYSYVNSVAIQSLHQFRLSFVKQSLGNNFWQKIYKYPTSGISILYSTLGNHEVLGEELAVYPFFCLKSLNKEKFILEHQIGLGFGYVTKKFDLKNNYTNIAVGSHLNLHFHYALKADFSVSERLKLGIGLAFDHFSNANLREPNLGINSCSTQLSAAFRLQKDKVEKRDVEVPSVGDKNEIAFLYAAGGKHTRALQSSVFFTSSVSMEYKRILGHKFHLGTGLDLFYDSSTKKEMSSDSLKIYHSSDDFRTGIHLAQEFVFEKFSLIIQEGIYVGLTNKLSSSKMYNRAILRYKWNKNFFTHISMKSHLHILDYPEIGFAYFFQK